MAFQIENDVLKKYTEEPGVTEVVIPEGVRQIGIWGSGNGVFSGCQNIKSVVVPNSVISISDYSFKGCTSLESIVIPDSVTGIGGGAFIGCSSLTSVVIPDSVTEIKYNAFEGCTSLESIVIPNSVTSIGSYAFEGCTALKDVTLSGNLKYLHPDSFSDTPWMKNYPEPFIISDQGVFLMYMGSEKDVVIPDGITAIADMAFQNNKAQNNVESVTIPASVRSIGADAFNYCRKLKTVVLCEGLESIGGDAFQSCEALKSINIPESVTSMNKTGDCYQWDRSETFNGCKSLKHIYIPAGVSSLPTQIFRGCTSLADIEISPDNASYSTIDGSVYSKDGKKLIIAAPGRKEIIIPAGVDEISRNAFCHTSAKRVVIESEAITICEGAFYDGYSSPPLSLIVFPKGMDKINYKWFGYDGDYGPVSVVIACLFRSAAVLNEKIKNFSKKERKKFAASLIEFIEANIEIKALKGANLVKAADYILDHPEDFSKEQLEEFLAAAKKKKAKKAIEAVEAYYSTLGNEENTSYPEFRKIFKESTFDAVLRNCSEAPKIMSRVKRADGTPVDDIYIVKCAVMPYYLQCKPLEKYSWGYDDRYEDYKIDKNAEKAASYLDKKSLSECVGKLYKKYGDEMFGFIVPLGRYGTDEQVDSIISDLNRWEGGRYSRNRCTTARGAVFISRSKPAIIYFEKWYKGSYNNCFEQYARFHETTIDDLREQLLADVGLDKDGVHVFDLGGKTVKAELGSDLKISLTDESNGKTVKSLPKKGADPDRHAAAAAELKKMKADLKKIVKERSKLFFEDFLSGRTRDAKSYLRNVPANPILRKMDENIVRLQGKNSFILTDNGTVDCFGQPYTVDENVPVGIAHPLELDSNTVRAWQDYLIKNGIRQPFEQMWEIVTDPKTIAADRYNGLTIPFMFFKGASKHGIDVPSGKSHCVSARQVDVRWAHTQKRWNICRYARPLYACTDSRFYRHLHTKRVCELDRRSH